MPGKGWKLPPGEPSLFTTCVTFRIPANPEFVTAAMGAILELTKWYNWEKTGDFRARDAAQVLRREILATLAETPCLPADTDGWGYWYWDVAFSKSVWSETDVETAGGNGPSRWVSGRGFVSDCVPPNYTWKGTALQTAFPEYNIGTHDLWLKIGGGLYDDLVSVNGNDQSLETNTGVLPQWVYIGRFLFGTNAYRIQIIRNECSPGDAPSIAAICVRSFFYPDGATPGPAPIP